MHGEHGEHDETARELIEGAVEELAAVGQADFTMDGVARRSYYSPGALYERWSERSQLIADVGRDHVVPEVALRLGNSRDADEAISWVLDDGRASIALLGEIMLAGATMPPVHPVALEAWRTLHDGLACRLPPGMAWFMAVYSLGNALLDVIGLPGPVPRSVASRGCAKPATWNAGSAGSWPTDRSQVGSMSPRCRRLPGMTRPRSR
ncbi:MAG: TetR/AcrR family transcriptional regulator [bacterium]